MKEKEKEKAPVTEEVPGEPVLDPVVEELKAAKDQLLRLAAEFDNFKKRSQREQKDTWLSAKAELFKAFLPVMDNFERALAEELPEGENGLEEYRKGVEMIFAQFAGVFTAQGVEAFGEPGDAFDPTLHNAVMHMEDEALGKNVLAAVFSKGYRLKEKLIREAMVGVAN